MYQLRGRTMLGQTEKFSKSVSKSNILSISRDSGFWYCCILKDSLFFCSNLPSLSFILRILQSPTRFVRKVLAYAPLKPLTMKNFISCSFSLNNYLAGWFQSTMTEIEERKISKMNMTLQVLWKQVARKWKNLWLSNPSIHCFPIFILSSTTDHLISCSALIILTDEAAEFDTLQSNFSYKYSCSRAGRMQGLQKHTIF